MAGADTAKWLPLKPTKSRAGVAKWTSCRPFVENARGLLIHRPRHVTVYDLGPRWGKHIGVTYYCGNSASGKKNFTFLDEVPEGALLCVHCEARAVMIGLPSSDSIVGRHVHQGRVVAQQVCCPPPPETP